MDINPAQAPAILQTLNAAGNAIIAFSTVTGLFLCGWACFIWWKNQKNPNGPTANHSPVWTFVAGVSLLLAPVLYNIFMRTGLGDTWQPSIQFGAADAAGIRAIEGSGQSPLLQFLPPHTVQIIAAFIYLLGLFSYLKGIMLLRWLGFGGDQRPEQGGSAGGKASAHILGGLFLMNINAAACVILGIFIAMSMCQ